MNLGDGGTIKPCFQPTNDDPATYVHIGFGSKIMQVIYSHIHIHIEIIHIYPCVFTTLVNRFGALIMAQ